MEFTAKLRTKTGSAESRRCRKSGNVPAVIYGRHMEQPIHISFNEETAESIMLSTAPLMTFKIEGGSATISKEVIIKKTQVCPLTDILLHVDFNEVTRGEKMHIVVPLKFKGHPSAAELAGGLLEHMLTQVTVECFPQDIPESLEIDISGLISGHPLHVKDIPVAASVRILNDPLAPTIAIVKKGKGAELEAAVPGEEAAGTEEPEVLTARKPKEGEESASAGAKGAPKAKEGGKDKK